VAAAYGHVSLPWVREDGTVIRSLETSYVGPASHLRVEFAPRLNVMTGDNGLGKSFLLECLWWTLTRGWRGDVARPRRGHSDNASIQATFDGKARSVTTKGRFDISTQRWLATRGRPPMPGLVIYVAADGGFSVWDPLRHHANSKYVSEFLDVPFQSSLVFDRSSLWNGLRLPGGAVLCRGLVEDWVAWQRDKDRRFAALEEVLSVLSEGTERFRPAKPQRARVGDARLFPTLRLPYGIEPVTHVSAGVQRVISLAYLLVWSWFEHREAARVAHEPTTSSIIFLFDEIEAHLHPRWQRSLLPSLLKVVPALSGAKDVQLIGATHSPLLCASVETIVDDKLDRLFTLDLVHENKSTDVTLTRVPWEPLGQVDTWLKSDLFDLTSTRSIAAEALLKEAAGLAVDATRSPQRVADLTRQLEHAIAPTDPFWARWHAITSTKR
jgi:hypothetical protein